MGTLIDYLDFWDLIPKLVKLDPMLTLGIQFKTLRILPMEPEQGRLLEDIFLLMRWCDAQVDHGARGYGDYGCLKT